MVAVAYGIMEVTFPHNLSNSTINIKVLQHTLQYRKRIVVGVCDLLSVAEPS